MNIVITFNDYGDLVIVCVQLQTVCGYDFNCIQVTFSTSQHLSSDSIDAINYRTLTNLRVQLLDRFVEIELSEQRFQYYSVSEWLVWGSCLCNGHAATCTPANGETIATDKVMGTQIIVNLLILIDLGF